MKILDKTMALDELKKMASAKFGDLVKVVVDVEREIVALDGELHSDLEALLLQDGSQQQDLWGVNLYPEQPGDAFVEFDSMINLRPSQGNRSRGVDDINIQGKIRKIVDKRISR